MSHTLIIFISAALKQLAILFLWSEHDITLSLRSIFFLSNQFGKV